MVRYGLLAQVLKTFQDSQIIARIIAGHIIGQILRTALFLATLLGRMIDFFGITISYDLLIIVFVFLSPV